MKSQITSLFVSGTLQQSLLSTYPKTRLLQYSLERDTHFSEQYRASNDWSLFKTVCSPVCAQQSQTIMPQTCPIQIKALHQNTGFKPLKPHKSVIALPFWAATKTVKFVILHTEVSCALWTGYFGGISGEPTSDKVMELFENLIKAMRTLPEKNAHTQTLAYNFRGFMGLL